MRRAAIALLAGVLGLTAIEARGQSRPLPKETPELPYVKQGLGYRPNYRSDYSATELGYRQSPFETHIGSHVQRREEYDYPVYTERHPLGYSRNNWSGLPRGYAAPEFSGAMQGYIPHERVTNERPWWAAANEESVNVGATPDFSRLHLPPPGTPAAQQLEEQMRPAAPPSFGQRVRSWLRPW